MSTSNTVTKNDLKAVLEALPIGATDYIAEQGTSGIWTYRKWNSGIAECWGIIYTTTKTIYGQMGGEYGVAFPFTFTGTPVATVAQYVNGDAFCYHCWSQVTTTRIDGYYLSPNTSAGASAASMVHIFGKWK